MSKLTLKPLADRVLVEAAEAEETTASDWLVKGLIDVEYKKYILLAYLKEVRENFGSYKLYPFLSDLIAHYHNLRFLKQNKQILLESFPERLTGADLEKLELKYEKLLNDDEVMKTIEEIVGFSLPLMKGALEDGKDRYEEVESAVEISPVGLSPLYLQEGYMLIQEHQNRETQIHRYKITFFERADEKFRAVNTEYLESVKKTIGTSYEKIKVELTRKFRTLPNPATYLVVARSRIPFNETFMPVAKRLLVRFISSTSNSDLYSPDSSSSEEEDPSESS